jgi:hypothetical protein
LVSTPLIDRAGEGYKRPSVDNDGGLLGHSMEPNKNNQEQGANRDMGADRSGPHEPFGTNRKIVRAKVQNLA